MGFIKWLEGLADNEFNSKQPKIGVDQAQALGRKANADLDSQIEFLKKDAARKLEDAKKCAGHYINQIDEIQKSFDMDVKYVTFPRMNKLLIRAIINGTNDFLPHELYLINQLNKALPRIIKIPGAEVYSCFTIFGRDKKHYYTSHGESAEEAYKTWMGKIVKVKYMDAQLAVLDSARGMYITNRVN